MNKIQIFVHRNEQKALFEEYIINKADSANTLEILEAGCGRRWLLNLNEIDYRLTGVDLDKQALNNRVTTHADLDAIVVGDLRSIDLGEGRYDVIFNSYVLEHIENAEAVLDNFYRWLKPGGILILRIPDRNSAFGFLTRITPFWFHVYWKKYIKGVVNAGRPGFDPYPTIYDGVVSRSGIQKYCEKYGLIIKEEYGSAFDYAGSGIVHVAARLLVRMVGFLSFGRLAWKYSGLTYIIEKM